MRDKRLPARHVAGVLVVAVLAMSLSGCAKGSTKAPSSARPVGVRIDRAAVDFLERLQFGGQSAAELDAAMRAELRECMARGGWTVQSKGFVRPGTDTAVGTPTNPPSVEHGYGIAGQLAPVDAESRLPWGEDFASTLPADSAAAFRVELFGPSVSDGPTSTGCFHLTEAKFMANTSAYNSFVAQALGDMEDAIRADRTYRDAQRAWASCMKRSGHGGLSEREELVTSLVKRVAPIAGAATAAEATRLKADLLADEQRLATADLACSATTGYDDKVRAVYQSHALTAAESIGYLG